MKIKWGIGIGIVLISVLLFYGWSMRFAKDAERNALNFCNALLNGDYDSARKLSAGTVHANLIKPDVANKKLSICSEEAHATHWGSREAQVEIAVSFRVEDVLNVQFYRVDLIRIDNRWCVYSLSETNPLITGSQSGWVNPAGFISVYKGYLESLSEGDYKQASVYLVGVARNLHEKTSPLLKNAKLLKSVPEVQGETLYCKGNYAVVKMSYVVNKRNITTLVHFYNTVEGWRMYQISPV